MSNPFNKDTLEAFEPFFFDECVISGNRKDNKSFSNTIKCAIFPLEDSDYFLDDDIQTNVEQIKITISKKDWNENYDIQIGDSINTTDEKKWKVCNIKKEQFWILITAKLYNGK